MHDEKRGRCPNAGWQAGEHTETGGNEDGDVEVPPAKTREGRGNVESTVISRNDRRVKPGRSQFATEGAD
ncbi:unnamed protein product [Phytophthora fragariaefolia]|uniref:Unnamed protein product n=1 Tax=Phytophthora fragariaefolia TaxID=1490495 RepID=A0A9W6Y7D1_9STRA|nr:unnamed protein product [Phytophthora fragariaefolia]